MKIPTTAPLNNTEQYFKRKIAFINDIEQLTGYSRSTIRRKWEKGVFPRPTLIDGSRLAWSTEVIEQWIDEQLKGKCHEQNK